MMKKLLMMLIFGMSFVIAQDVAVNVQTGTTQVPSSEHQIIYGAGASYGLGSNFSAPVEYTHSHGDNLVLSGLAARVYTHNSYSVYLTTQVGTEHLTDRPYHVAEGLTATLHKNIKGVSVGPSFRWTHVNGRNEYAETVSVTKDFKFKKR